jgi:hypothetical protein
MSEIIKRGELPKRPIPGLVIRYSYLWHREAQEKRIEGLKADRARLCSAIPTFVSFQGGLSPT